MIKLLQSGQYLLNELKAKEIVLTVDRTKYICANDQGITVFLETKQRRKAENSAMGRYYRLYEVKYEPLLQSGIHLEVHVGDGVWQGYTLPDGLPKNKLGKINVVPTDELITKVTGK